VTDDRVAVVEGVGKAHGSRRTRHRPQGGRRVDSCGTHADGITEIYNIKYIDRGYDHIEEKLNSLGADIRREQIDPEKTFIIIEYKAGRNIGTSGGPACR
jgi:UDP-N-acetylglucosamine 1-carboxyvinyltransferase